MATFSDYVKNIFWVLLLLQFAPLFIKSMRSQYSDLFEEKTRVGVISITGEIEHAGPTVNEVKKFFEDKSLKAIVLKVDSPGGVSSAGQAIFREILYYKKLHPEKYVVGYVERLAASAGYYIATAADYIIATPSSTIGSIGVVIQHPSFKELLEKIHISYSITKTGEYKGIGNPFLTMTPEEKAIFQEMSNDTYKQFLRDVAVQRPQLSTNTKLWAEGKIFTGEQALALKLIDEIGSPSTVEKVLREKAPIVGKVEWIKPAKKRSVLASLFGQEDDEESTNNLSSFVDSICRAVESRYATHSMLS
jgi:protease-4